MKLLIVILFLLTLLIVGSVSATVITINISEDSTVCFTQIPSSLATLIGAGGDTSYFTRTATTADVWLVTYNNYDYQRMSRYLMSVNLSSIPAGSTINSVKLTVYSAGKSDGAGPWETNVVLTNASPSNSSLHVYTDYGTKLGYWMDPNWYAFSNWPADGVMFNFTFGTDGLVYMRNRLGSNASFMLRGTSDVYGYLDGSWGASQWSTISSYTADSTKKPFLTINYTNNAPIAGFTKDKTTGGAPLKVTFTDTSTNAPTSWFWVFGDGSTENNTVQNPVHSFLNAGIYNVNLTATNAFGSNISATQSITVTNQDIVYNATHWASTSYGLSYGSFQDGYYWKVSSSYTGGGHIYKYDPNTFSQLADASPPHDWRESYTPLVHGGYVYIHGYNQTTATPNSNYIDIFYESNLTYVTTIVGIMGNPIYDPIHDKILFNEFGGASPPDTNITFFQVDPDKTLNQSTYTQVTVASAPEVFTSAESTMLVWNGAVWYIVNDGGTSGKWYTHVYKSTDLTNWALQWSASDSTGGIYGFNQGGDNNQYLGIAYANGTTSHISWTSDGTTWKDYDTGIGFTAYENHPILWVPGANTNLGVFAFSVRERPTYVDLYTFNFTSSGNLTYQLSMPDTSTKQYSETDRQNSLEQAPNGNIFVSENMIGGAGSYISQIVEYSISAALTGTPIPAVSTFTSDNTVGTVPFTVQFTDTSANTSYMLNYYWDFGDGNTSYLENPSYTYYSVGSYTVKHSVATSMQKGWSNQTNYITVNPAMTIPVANFTSNVTQACINQNIQFNDTSTGPPDTWAWDFGDTGTSTNQNDTHAYGTAGLYTVALTASNILGSNTSTKSNYINATNCVLPTTSFTTNTTCGTSNVSVQFTDTSSGGVTYYWNFGDGNTSTAKNPAYKYVFVGQFNVSHSATNTFGTTWSNKTNLITVTFANTSCGSAVCNYGNYSKFFNSNDIAHYNTSYLIANQPVNRTTEYVWIIFALLGIGMLIMSTLDVDRVTKDLTSIFASLFLFVSTIQAFSVDTLTGYGVTGLNDNGVHEFVLMENHIIYHYDFLGVTLGICFIVAIANQFRLWLEYRRIEEVSEEEKHESEPMKGNE